MRVAIPAIGTDLAARVDRSFGRCRNFIIYDLASEAVTAVPNTQNLELTQGAGIQAARTVVEQEVDCVITGHCGPKAFAALQAGDIMVVLGADGTVQEAIDAFKAGRLKPAEQADVEGHWV